MARSTKTPTDWWPASLAHIPDEDPWAASDVIVAEIMSRDGDVSPGTRMTISALVPVDDLDGLRANPASLGHEVSASGPRPYPGKDAYTPKFWIEACGEHLRKYEPLVLSWGSHDRTVFLPDPGFLMTYGLIHRAGTDGATIWDDPTGPIHDVVTVSKPSGYDFPKTTPAFVSVSKTYLEDYLSLRRMALVQSYWERRFCLADDEINARLGDKETVDLDTPGRRMRLHRIGDQRGLIVAEAFGSRIVAMPGPLPISNGRWQTEGLVWPGIDGPVGGDRARRMHPDDFVYVSDRVLAGYEGRPEYQVFPESGAVRFGTQWSVSFCKRVGRDVIRIELKKLYEGVPSHVTQTWHNHAVEPPTNTSHKAVEAANHVARRAKKLTYGLVTLAENLAKLAQSVGASDQFIALRRQDLDYRGWSTFAESEAISRHIPRDLPLDGFLDRCMSLTKLLIEGLRERPIREILRALCAPDKAIKDLGTLKLLDRVICMCQVANETGLALNAGDSSVWDRLSRDGTTPARPITHLFALYDLRIVKAHVTGDRAKLFDCLSRFGIDQNDTTAGYGLALDRVYDALIAELDRVNQTVAATTGRGSAL